MSEKRNKSKRALLEWADQTDAEKFVLEHKGIPFRESDNDVKVEIVDYKEPAMSEFKVGDKVVYRKQCSMIWRGVYTVDAVRSNGDVIERDCISPKEWLSKATPEEVTAGHRIDNDMGDDSHIENHISPLCKSKDV